MCIHNQTMYWLLQPNLCLQLYPLQNAGKIDPRANWRANVEQAIP